MRGRFTIEPPPYDRTMSFEQRSVFRTDDEEEAWNFVERAREGLSRATEELFGYLRAEYPEIDLEAASEEAGRTFESL